MSALRQELPGILNWAIEGCLLWQAEGLNAPASNDVTQILIVSSSGLIVAAFIAEGIYFNLFARTKEKAHEKHFKPLHSSHFTSQFL